MRPPACSALRDACRGPGRARGRARPGALLALAVAPGLALGPAPGPAELRGQKGLRTYRSGESILKSNASAEVSRTVSERIDNFCAIYEDFYDGLGLDRKNDNKVAVRLFSTREEYEARWRRLYPDRRVPQAYFSPSLNALVVYDDGGRVTLRATLMHECSHQFLNRYVYGAPKWLDEGLAEYFEGWRLTEEGERVEKRPLLFDLILLRAALANGAGAWLRPETLVGLSAEAFDDFPGGRRLHPYLHYATAWSVVWHCLEGADPDDRTRLVDYLRALQEDGVGARFEVDDWAAFEERWRATLASLEPELEDAEDHFLVADGYFESGEYARAREHFRRVAELDPDYPRIDLELAECAYWLGDFATAQERYRAALAHEPRSPRLAARLARALRPTDAEAALEAALAASRLADDEDPWILDLVAQCQLDTGAPRDAARTLRRALRLVDEDDDVAYFEERLERARSER